MRTPVSWMNEWRALTVALLDFTGGAARGRARPRQDLAAPRQPITEGGSLGGRPRDWRSSAALDGSPPLRIISDGTVF